MTNHTRHYALIVVLAIGLTGCDGAGPTMPSVPPTTPPPISSSGSGARLGVTLSGVVFETTSAGRVPIANASVYCDACGIDGHSWQTTDGNGYYSFSGDLGDGGGIWVVNGQTTVVFVSREGYVDPPGMRSPADYPVGARQVVISGDTRFDVELLRQ